VIELHPDESGLMLQISCSPLECIAIGQAHEQLAVASTHRHLVVARGDDTVDPVNEFDTQGDGCGAEIRNISGGDLQRGGLARGSPADPGARIMDLALDSALSRPDRLQGSIESQSGYRAIVPLFVQVVLEPLDELVELGNLRALPVLEVVSKGRGEPRHGRISRANATSRHLQVLHARVHLVGAGTKESPIDELAHGLRDAGLFALECPRQAAHRPLSLRIVAEMQQQDELRVGQAGIMQDLVVPGSRQLGDHPDPDQDLLLLRAFRPQGDLRVENDSQECKLHSMEFKRLGGQV